MRSEIPDYLTDLHIYIFLTHLKKSLPQTCEDLYAESVPQEFFLQHIKLYLSCRDKAKYYQWIPSCKQEKMCSSAKTMLCWLTHYNHVTLAGREGVSGGRARQHDQVISKQSYRGAARKLLSYSMQQRYLLTPGGQRLYSAAKLDVEWGNIFYLFIFIYLELRAVPSYGRRPRGEGCGAWLAGGVVKQERDETFVRLSRITLTTVARW